MAAHAPLRVCVQLMSRGLGRRKSCNEYRDRVDGRVPIYRMRNAWAISALTVVHFAVCLMAAQTCVAGSDPLFDNTRLLTIRIDAAPHRQPRDSEQRPYFAATLTTSKATYTNVEIRLKGHGSFRPLSDRPNLAVRFGGSERFYGYKKILLNNSAQDVSFLHWKLASELCLKAGLPAARVNFCRLALNGRDLGPYLIVETANRDFLARHFRSARGNLYEGSNNDVEDRLEQDAGNRPSPQTDLKALARACREPN